MPAVLTFPTTARCPVRWTSGPSRSGRSARAGGTGTGVVEDGSWVDFDSFATERIPALTRYATMLAGGRELGEDIVQDALVKAHAKWSRISELDRPDLYVKRIVTNEFLSWRRRRRLRTVELREEHAAAAMADRPPSTEETTADRDALWSELAALPRQQRVVLVLRFYEGLSDSEIAEIMGCRPATVRGYASRALSTLRIELAEWRAPPSEDTP